MRADDPFDAVFFQKLLVAFLDEGPDGGAALDVGLIRGSSTVNVPVPSEIQR